MREGAPEHQVCPRSGREGWKPDVAESWDRATKFLGADPGTLSGRIVVVPDRFGKPTEVKFLGLQWFDYGFLACYEVRPGVVSATHYSHVTVPESSRG